MTDSKLALSILERTPDLVIFTQRTPHGIASHLFRMPLHEQALRQAKHSEAVKDQVRAIATIKGVVQIRYRGNHDVQVAKANVFDWREVLTGLLPIFIDNELLQRIQATSGEPSPIRITSIRPAVAWRPDGFARVIHDFIEAPVPVST